MRVVKGDTGTAAAVSTSEGVVVNQSLGYTEVWAALRVLLPDAHPGFITALVEQVFPDPD